MKWPLLKITAWLEVLITVRVPEGQLAQEKANSHWVRRICILSPLPGTESMYFRVRNMHVRPWHTHIINQADTGHYYALSGSPNNILAEQRLLAERLQSMLSFVLPSSPLSLFALRRAPPVPPAPAPSTPCQGSKVSHSSTGLISATFRPRSY